MQTLNNLPERFRPQMDEFTKSAWRRLRRSLTGRLLAGAIIGALIGARIGFKESPIPATVVSFTIGAAILGALAVGLLELRDRLRSHKSEWKQFRARAIKDMNTTTESSNDSPFLKEDVEVVLITLSVAGEQTLLILLAREGTINRMGGMSESPEDRHPYIWKTDGTAFRQFMATIDDEMFSCQGSYILPDKRGKDCELLLRFSDSSDTRKAWLRFIYGTESQGPPAPIPQIVMKALELTEPSLNKQPDPAQTAEPEDPY